MATRAGGAAPPAAAREHVAGALRVPLEALHAPVDEPARARPAEGQSALGHQLGQQERHALGEQIGGGLHRGLRELGVLVGYFIGFVAPGLHYRTCLTLTMDIFWTHPDIRKGFAAVRMFREVEREAKRRGVQRIFYGSKAHKDASKLFEFLRMDPVEVYYSKWIGD